ncbi:MULTISPECIES: HesB/YadR/YfhF family protein [Paenibacillus]|uniref:HesB/YadR/YfhF family protein n=1 Tax=Paenibacillus TaxID=44249 RepID=UPI000368FD92|nr:MULTISPECIES: HesB/YadR/YfhF family protein [Paenibacillus]
MSIAVSDEAARWYKKELDLQEGDALRFYARYSSNSDIHPGFSLGISVEPPISPGLEQKTEGIQFYMEAQDLWYLNGYKLNVEYMDNEDDIRYAYIPES